MARFVHRSSDLLRRASSNTIASRASDRIVNPVLFGGHGVRYRKLEVILTTDIDKLGKGGEVVKVAPGHFRNHLMPKLLAVPNLMKFAKVVQEQQKKRQVDQHKEVETVPEVPKTEVDKMKEYQTAAKRLDSARLVLRKSVKADSELRLPVMKDELIAEVARQLCVNIEPENLHLPSPLSSPGEFEVPLRLPRSIPLPEGKNYWSLNVKIRR
ncbi:hypothetical protein QJS04_geneDACA003847 [Acorus gramineus]|uniref:Large ribosomal subunit protein bL9c n=1 Tax=Acorus gramineus TaxID=55184 RepID=A0AAV9BHJ2_ACOGR|nr:hypothetical protein QJS04_geneDACA003847 [Acorus gramineus]